MAIPYPDLVRRSESLSYGAVGDFCILAARILIGITFVQSGWPKLLSYGDTVNGLVHRGVPDFFAYLAPAVEFFGGLAVMFGLVTSYAALLMLLFTIAATITAHRFWEYADPAQYRAQSINFWKNISMMGGMVLLFVTAGGRFSLDAWIFGLRSQRPHAE